VNAALLKTHLPNHPTQLYLIRHGEVEEKYHKVFGGCRIDMNLSPHGQRQAEALDAWLADTKLDAVYASPMKRVQQTMAPLLVRRSVEPTIMQDLREIDFGDWTGHTWGGIHENFGINVFDWLEVLEDPGAPNGESAQQLADRVRPCLIQVLHDNPHRTAAIVCHGGIIRVILALLLELPLAKMAHFNIEYASVTVIEINPERKHAAELELLNFQALR
jgi:broad specificity phosphatase PhoE